ncbi:MAG: geranylgeranylglyceryl/heptaprenylglyceryl phosphate synthase [Thermoprotei archaeon]
MGKVLDLIVGSRLKGPILFGLVDPATLLRSSQILKVLETYGSVFDFILVGGSTSVWQTQVETSIAAIRSRTNKPIIIFPGGLTNLTPMADAVLFMSLMNSSNTFYLVEQQFQAAPIIRQMGLEPISTAYIIVGQGGTAGYVGHARPIPYEKKELACAYAMAAQYFGFKLVYLEAGSGSGQPVPAELVSAVKSSVDIPVIVGGGIRRIDQYEEAVTAGADGVILGNVLENFDEAKLLLEPIRQRLAGR